MTLRKKKEESIGTLKINAMAQLDPMQKYSPKTPKPTSPTFEQLLHDLGHSSPINTKNLDIEEYFNQQNKKSVLSRMRDKVKKFRHNLSAKKMDEYPPCGNTTPLWGSSLDDNDHDDDDEDDDHVDDDPEYLGAPMYESEQAPESFKESARQHPRAVPVLSERHIVPSIIRHKAQDEKHTPPSKTITEAVSEKLAPAYAVVSDVTHTIASSIVNLKITSQKEQEKHRDSGVAKVLSHQKSIKSPGESDKGVSVKQYVMHKLEPGDDEKALSKVLCDALSPTKKSQGDRGVVGKMREVVTSILRDEERVKSKAKLNKLSTDIHLSANPKVSLQHSISAPTTNLSPRVAISTSAKVSSPIPVSTNPREVSIVVEEENHGRVLQAN